MNQKTNKKLDLLVLMALMGLGVFYSILTAGTYLGKGLIVGAVFLVLPTLYLALRPPRKSWKKIFLGTFIFGILFGFALDFIAEYTLAWTVTSTVFESRILGVNTIDSVLGIAMMSLITFTFYEHFVDDEKVPAISRRLKRGLIFAVVACTILILIWRFSPGILDVRYPYLYMGVVALIPTVLLGIKKPQLFAKMAAVALYFFLLYFVFELIAVKYDFWVYNGDNYIGWVELLGLRYPLEELIFWMLFYSSAIISYYEILVDDGR